MIKRLMKLKDNTMSLPRGIAYFGAALIALLWLFFKKMGKSHANKI